MNIYVGPSSAYARNEGVWVQGYGVTEETVGGLIALILRDMARGYGYDESGNPIRVTPALGAQRLNYLIALSAKHRGGENVRRAAEYAKRNLRVPPWVKLNIAGPNAQRVLRELLDLGVITPEQAGARVAVTTRRKKVAA